MARVPFRVARRAGRPDRRPLVGHPAAIERLLSDAARLADLPLARREHRHCRPACRRNPQARAGGVLEPPDQRGGPGPAAVGRRLDQDAASAEAGASGLGAQDVVAARAVEPGGRGRPPRQGRNAAAPGRNVSAGRLPVGLRPARPLPVAGASMGAARPRDATRAGGSGDDARRGPASRTPDPAGRPGAAKPPGVPRRRVSTSSFGQGRT